MVPRGGGWLWRRRGRGVELGGFEEGEGLGERRRRRAGGGSGGAGERRIVGGGRGGGGGGSGSVTEDLLVGRDLYEVLAGVRPLPTLLSVHGARGPSREGDDPQVRPLPRCSVGTIRLLWARVAMVRPVQDSRYGPVMD